MADFLNAARPEEIVFGPNMTTLTFSISRALARTFQPGDTLVVTRLDHDANISPWLRVAEDRGCRVRWVDIDPEDWHPRPGRSAKPPWPKGRAWWRWATPPTRWGRSTRWRRSTAWPSRPARWSTSTRCSTPRTGRSTCSDLGCDFLVCSAYKFFGPHVGVLYGRYELLESLRAYKVRPAPTEPPGKFETGTGNFEGIAGMLGALEYFEWLGEHFGAGPARAVRRDLQRAPADVEKRHVRPARLRDRIEPRDPGDPQADPRCVRVRPHRPAPPRPARADRLLHPGRSHAPADRRASSTSAISTPGTAISTPWPSPTASGWSPTAACCASAPPTTTRWTKSSALGKRSKSSPARIFANKEEAGANAPACSLFKVINARVRGAP